MSTGRERECWHSGGCPYKAAFDPDEGEDILHDPYELARFIEFSEFCMETSELPDKNAPPAKKGQQAKTVTKHSLSLEKFRLALELWGIENPEHRRDALRHSGTYISAADGAKDRALKRQREQAARRRKN
jgi:hypothetical protein